MHEFRYTWFELLSNANPRTQMCPDMRNLKYVVYYRKTIVTTAGKTKSLNAFRIHSECYHLK